MSQDLLNRIRTEASQNNISLDELVAAYKEGSKEVSNNTTIPEISPQLSRIRFSLPTLIAYIGGLVIAIGISIIIGVNWVYYSDPLRLFLTLGLGLSFFMLANGIMLKLLRYSFLANICHLLAGLLIPSGVFYWLSLLLPSTNINDSLILGSVFLVLGLLYLMTDLIFKKGLPILYTLIYLTISFFSFYSLILFNSDLGRSIVDYRLMQWGFLFGSIIYLLIAFCSWNWQRYWFLYLILNIGTIGFYISVFSLVYYIPGYEDFKLTGSPVTETIFIPASGSKILEFLFGLLYIPFYYLGTRINSGWLLLITTLSLITWLIYLNSRYFFGQANFGVGLVTSGLIMIGVSIGSIKLSQWLKKSRKVV